MVDPLVDPRFTSLNACQYRHKSSFMATIAIVLKTKKPLANNEFAVALRVTHGKTSRFYNFSSLYLNDEYHFRCTKEDWINASIEDNGLGRFRKTVTNYKELNQYLEEKLAFAREILKSYDDNDTDFDFQKFEIELRKGRVKPSKQKQTVSLQGFYTSILSQLDQQNKIGLYSIFYETQSMLKKFRPTALITDVNIDFLERFEDYMRYERKNKDTTISVKIRNLQRLLNIAIEEGLFKRDNYPFGEKKYSVNRRLNHKTKKRSVPINVMSKIKNLELEKGSALDLARDIFMFSFYTRGMNFIDIIGLTKNSIIDNEIYYIRSKTKQPFYIPINEYISAIIKKYGVNGDYLFPIYNDKIHVTLKQKYTRKKTALKKVNADLKEIAKLIGEPNINLTTYVSRHSYATNLKHAGVATSYISEALGHQTEEQTRTYLDEFEKGVISEFEKKIFDI